MVSIFIDGFVTELLKPWSVVEGTFASEEKVRQACQRFLLQIWI